MPPNLCSFTLPCVDYFSWTSIIKDNVAVTIMQPTYIFIEMV